MPELRRTELHILAEAGTRSITKETLPAMRRFDFSQSYPRATFGTTVGCIPDISVPVFIALWPHRGYSLCLFFRIGRRVVSAPCCPPCGKNDAKGGVTGSGRTETVGRFEL